MQPIFLASLISYGNKFKGFRRWLRSFEQADRPSVKFGT